MTRTTWLAAAALMLAAGTAQAQAQAPAPASTMLTTATLGELCGAAPTVSEAPATAFCRGFIIGAGQYHHAATRANQRPLFCLPTPGPTQAEFQTAFASWARANPQFGQERAADGLARFAAATYPCPQARPARATTR